MKGDDVVEFQTLVTRLGIDCGEIDGKYGKLSKKGCEAFQKKYGLKVDGKCGPLTWAKLQDVKQPEKDYLKLLKNWGFAKMLSTQGEKETIKQFQACMGLSVDGIVGNQTMKALNQPIIVPRIQENEIKCSCEGRYCDGFPKGSGAGQAVLILAERIFQEVEKKYPDTIFFVTSREHNPGSGIAGGYRCEKWNSLRGGAAGSQHKYGRALDIYGYNPSVKQSVIRSYIESVAKKMNTKGGVGYGARYIVHIDTRGNRARWKY